MENRMLLGKRDVKKRLLDHAWGHAQLGMPEDAVKDCEALVGLDKDDPSSYVELGYYLEKNGKAEEAIDCYRYLMRRFPGYNTAYSNLGYLYQSYKKQFDIAMLLYEKALELNPADIWALNNIGTILQEEGRWEGALYYYQKASETLDKLEKERVFQILHNLGWAYYRCKKYEKACAVFDCLVRENGDDPSVFSDFGCVLYKMEKFEDARALFEIALKMCPASHYYKKLWKVAYQKCL